MLLRRPDPTKCLWCDEPIEQGLVMHLACRLRAVIGGANHLLGTCSCCGGNQPPDPPGLTAREAALVAAGVWMRQRRSWPGPLPA